MGTYRRNEPTKTHQQSRFIKWHGDDAELVELLHQSTRRPRPALVAQPRLTDPLNRRGGLPPGSQPCADPQGRLDVIKKGPRRPAIPAAKEHRKCSINYQSGELNCESKSAPAEECRLRCCPHVELMRMRLKKRLRKAAPEIRRLGERYLSRTATEA